MRTQIPQLFQYEFDALLEALRRDLRAEQQRRHVDAEYAECHEFNSRMSKKLLEVLAPRSNRSGRPRCAPRQPVSVAAAAPRLEHDTA